MRRAGLLTGLSAAGLLCGLALLLVYFKGNALIGQIGDERLARVSDLGLRILEKDVADAAILAVPLAGGAKRDVVLKALVSRAKELGLSDIKQRQITLPGPDSGKPAKTTLTVVDFCASPPALRLFAERTQLLVYAPCRLTLYTDHDGQLWIAGVDLERLLDGGRPLARDLIREARQFRDSILDIMASAANAARDSAMDAQ